MVWKKSFSQKTLISENIWGTSFQRLCNYQDKAVVPCTGKTCQMRFSYLGFCLGAHQTEVNKVEVKSIGFSGARETETGVCACCGSSNLKEIESKTRKLLKESIQKFIRKNTNLSLHWPRLYRAGRKLLQVISELHGDSKGHKSLRDIRVLNNLRKKNVLHIRPNLLTYFMRWASLALYTLYLP